MLLIFKKNPNCELLMSVDIRAIIDYKVGISFSKLLTYEILDYIDEKSISDKKVLSYGPCQTPTLWFCVQRKKQIDNFIPSIFYKIYIEIITENGEIHKIYLKEEFSSKIRAKIFFEYINRYFYLKVKNIKTQRKIKDSPEGLKTTTMLKLASSQLKISPNEASEYAQYLYMKGAISYPRTSTTKYSPYFDFEESLEIFLYKKDVYQDIYDDICNLYQNFDKRRFDFSKGVEKGGHQPIIPTSYYSISSDNYSKLHYLICLYYFASISPPMEYEIKEYKMKIGDYSFIGSSSKIIKEGFLVFRPHKKKEFVSEFPDLKENKNYRIYKIGIEEKMSESPDYLTESELIDEMEKYNIGTDGSIPSHIYNLTLRGYVKVDEKKRIIPTKLGIALIDALNVVEPDIIMPENRAKIEQFVKDIEKVKKSYNEDLEYAIKF